MSKKRGYGHLLMAVFLSISLCLVSAGPVAAADFTGKTVTSVAVTGANFVPTSTVLAVVKVRPGDSLAADKIKQDMQAIYDLGYFFDVTSNFTEVPEGVAVTYQVMENPILMDIVVKGNTKVTTEQISKLITVKKGQILNSKTLNENMRAVEQYYHDQGFVLTKVSDVSISPQGVLSIAINEGTLEGIVVKGNDKTKSYVITREMKVKVGEPFNAKDARRSMQKVYNLGFFEDVNMKLNPGRNPNAVILETDVVEQKTGFFSIGGGYSESDGMIGIIEVGDNNFRGIGDKMKVHWEFGGNASDISNTPNYSFSYTKPWLDSKQTSLSVNLYDMTNEYSDYYSNGSLKSTYYKERHGWDLMLGRPAGEFIQNYITLKNNEDTWLENVDSAGAPIDYGAEGVQSDGKTYGADYLKNNFGLTRSVIFSRVFDNRDNVYNATEGKRFSVSAEFAGKGLGGDFDFNKYIIENRNYIKVGHAQTVALRFIGGYATGTLPESQLFAVGGAETLRGYEDDQFKGTKMVAATAEYRFPLAKKVDGVFFGDVGNAWGSEAYNMDSSLHYAIGTGVRINSPLGPIRLDFAKGEQGGKFHFSFGGQF
ncbi:MAG: surface antigen [Firmicutes bacterium]|nr:surface antigen [Bacillota bacterium]